jgi:hypothetical protein
MVNFFVLCTARLLISPGEKSVIIITILARPLTAETGVRNLLGIPASRASFPVVSAHFTPKVSPRFLCRFLLTRFRNGVYGVRENPVSQIMGTVIFRKSNAVAICVARG